MARKRLIIHIGMHKTGSSSIQRYLSRNRWLLGRLGVTYPISIGAAGERQPKHAALADAIAHEADHGAAHPVLGPSADVLADLAAQIEQAPGPVGIISAEALSGPKPEFAARLAPLNNQFDVSVIVFLRRRDQWLASFHRQMIMSRAVRETRSLQDFANAPETRAQLDYGALLDRWAAAFGADALRVRIFAPEADPRPPVLTFLEAAGLPRYLRWAPHKRAHVNRSVTAATAAAQRAANMPDAGMDSIVDDGWSQADRKRYFAGFADADSEIQKRFSAIRLDNLFRIS